MAAEGLEVTTGPSAEAAVAFFFFFEMETESNPQIQVCSVSIDLVLEKDLSFGMEKNLLFLLATCDCD